MTNDEQRNEHQRRSKAKMARINLDNGRWFDPDTSTSFPEQQRWDGKNHISVATGSQWEHERLYRTRGGTWVLHRWSQWQGTVPHYEIVSADIARQWLVQHADDAIVEEHFPGTLATGEV